VKPLTPYEFEEIVLNSLRVILEAVEVTVQGNVHNNDEIDEKLDKAIQTLDNVMED
jgi:hypothetical protein